jgi:branched-chain amino acid transport system substrate-binding protein
VYFRNAASPRPRITKLAEAIRDNPEFDSVYGGTMTYQDNGVASKNVALFRVEGGESAFVKYVSAN